MIGWLWRRVLARYARRYATDVGYLEFMRAHNGAAFRRLLLASPASAHRGGVPARAVFAARIVAVLAEDCGPCVALVARMTEEAGMEVGAIRALLQQDELAMDPDVRVAAAFAEALLARSDDLDGARERAVALWGEGGVVSLSLAVATSRLFPVLKRGLGFGKICSVIEVGSERVVPCRTPR